MTRHWGDWRNNTPTWECVLVLLVHLGFEWQCYFPCFISQPNIGLISTMNNTILKLFISHRGQMVGR